MSNTSPYTVEATETSLAILETLVDSDDALGVTALADEVDVAKSVVHNHLSTLRNRGYIVKRGTKYEPSLRPLNLGIRTRAKIPVYQAAQTQLDNLAAAADETVTLFVLEEYECTPAYIATTSESWVPEFHEGEQLPLHMSAPGKAILASLSDEQIEEVLEQTELVAATKATVTDPSDLKAQIRNIRDDGVAFCRGEQFPGIVGVAAPIPMPESDRIAALGVTGPTDRLKGRYLQEDITGQVVRTAKSIQVALTNS